MVVHTSGACAKRAGGVCVVNVVTGVIWDTFGWILDNPTWSASIVAGVVFCVVFALPAPRGSKK